VVVSYLLPPTYALSSAFFYPTNLVTISSSGHVLYTCCSGWSWSYEVVVEVVVVVEVEVVVDVEVFL
jgi:hypothetical protein